MSADDVTTGPGSDAAAGPPASTDAPASGAATGPEGPDAGLPPELLEIRRSIDNIDAALVHLLAERFNHTKRVGRIKARYGLPPADPAREARQIERLRTLAAQADLDPDFAEKFLQFLVTEVIRHHRAIAREEGAADGPHEPPEPRP